MGPSTDADPLGFRPARVSAPLRARTGPAPSPRATSSTPAGAIARATLALALALLAPGAWAQPAPADPAPTAEEIAEAYENSLRFELGRAQLEAAAAAGLEGFLAGVAGVAGAEATARLEKMSFVVTLYACAPAAGDVGHVCTYAYHVEDAGEGVSAGFVSLVRGHVFPGPDGLVVHELPTPGPLGPQGGLFAGPRP